MSDYFYTVIFGTLKDDILEIIVASNSCFIYHTMPHSKAEGNSMVFALRHSIVLRSSRAYDLNMTQIKSSLFALYTKFRDLCHI